MSHKSLLKYCLAALVLTACGQQQDAGLNPVIEVNQKLAEELDQINFWLYEVLDKNNEQLTCERLMLNGNQAIDPNDTSLFNISFSDYMVFHQQLEHVKTFNNIPVGKGYILYARGYKALSTTSKITKAQGCTANVNIVENETNPVTIELTAASAN